MSDIPRILVVDDEPNDNQFITATVRGLGHATQACFDGQSAIDWLQQNKPALVLLDALLPKVDGFTVLREVRSRYPDVPVYMLSGVYKKKSYEQEAVSKLGATAYLHKPVGVLQLWEILERHAPSAGGEVSPDFPGVPFWRRPLPAVVADLWAGGKTGLLFVRGAEHSAILFFEDGRLVFGRCNEPQLRIDRVLMHQGKLAKEQLGRVAEIAAQAKTRLGEALVAAGLITHDDLAEALSLQQRNHVSRPLTWPEGACWFYPCDAPRAETFKLQLDVPSLVFWAARHLQVDEHLLRFLPKPGRTLRLKRAAAEIASAFSLNAEEAKLLALLDGSRSLGQVRAIGRMLALDVERILAGLHCLGLLEATGADEPREATTAFGAGPVAGDLSRYPPSMLLVNLAFACKSGVLHVESGDGGPTRTVHFDEGRVAFGSSTDPGDRIGQVLLRSRLITREQLSEALARSQASPGVPLGRILVDAGMLGPDDLHAALVHQAQQVITGVVSARAGTFRFQENDGPSRDIVPLGLDTRQVLMTALRTCAFTDIAPRLPPPQTRLRVTETAHLLAADLPLTEIEQQLRRQADGSITVQDIAGSAPGGPEAALRAIFTLTAMGIIEGFLLQPPAQAPPPMPVRATVDVDLPLAEPVGDARVPPSSAETTAERATRARAQKLDETFDQGESAPALAEDWSAAEEASFSDMAAQREDWSAPEEASFADVAVATEPARPALAAVEPEMDGGLAWNLPGPAAPAAAPSRAAAGTAVAEAWDERKLESLCEFLARLSDWLKTCPEAVPESVRAALDEDTRTTFGL